MKVVKRGKYWHYRFETGTGGSGAGRRVHQGSTRTTDPAEAMKITRRLRKEAQQRAASRRSP